MSTEHKGNMIRDIPPSGEMLKKRLPEGEMLVSEGPKGDPLWKKKKKLNEENGKLNTLNESCSFNIKR